MKAEMRFSVVIPIHNEQAYLPYSLPSVFALHPDEVILLFDRCTDNSLKLAEQIVNHYAYSAKTKFVRVDEDCDFVFRTSYLRRLGYRMAKNDVILTADADMVLDRGIPNYFTLIGKDGYAFISFEYIDFPISFRNLLKRLLERLKLPFPWLSGTYVFRRETWLDTEDTKKVKDVERSEDTHLHQAIRRKYRTRCVLTRTYHLRPRESWQRHYLRGRLHWRVAHRSFLLTFLKSVVLFRFNMIKGYIHERFG